MAARLSWSQTNRLESGVRKDEGPAPVVTWPLHSHSRGFLSRARQADLASAWPASEPPPHADHALTRRPHRPLPGHQSLGHHQHRRRTLPPTRSACRSVRRLGPRPSLCRHQARLLRVGQRGRMRSQPVRLRRAKLTHRVFNCFFSPTSSFPRLGPSSCPSLSLTRQLLHAPRLPARLPGPVPLLAGRLARPPALARGRHGGRHQGLHHHAPRRSGGCGGGGGPTRPRTPGVLAGTLSDRALNPLGVGERGRHERCCVAALAARR